MMFEILSLEEALSDFTEQRVFDISLEIQHDADCKNQAVKSMELFEELLIILPEKSQSLLYQYKEAMDSIGAITLEAVYKSGFNDAKQILLMSIPHRN